METKQQLLKLFAQSLRNRANQGEASINPLLLRYLSRKELIYIIKDLHNGSLPKEIDLIEMENEALLKLIGNDLAIIAFMTAKWCKEEVKEKTNGVKTSAVSAQSLSKTPTPPKKKEELKKVPPKPKNQ